MVGLTELEQRILAVLEEAGENNSYSVLNTIIDGSGDEGELVQYVAALTSLISSGALVLGWYYYEPLSREWLSREKSLEIASGLSDLFVFDKGTQLWSQKGGWIGAKSRPVMLASRAARKIGGDLLDERGYMWWRKPRKERD